VEEVCSPVVAWKLDSAHIAVPIDLSVYSIGAAMRVAYKFTDRCFVFIERDANRNTGVMVYLVGRARSADLSSIALDFRNELLDQQLRCHLEEQFRDVRTLIVAQAFSEGNLIDGDADEGDYRSDPRGAGQHR